MSTPRAHHVCKHKVSRFYPFFFPEFLVLSCSRVTRREARVTPNLGWKVRGTPRPGLGVKTVCPQPTTSEARRGEGTETRRNAGTGVTRNGITPEGRRRDRVCGETDPVQ